MRDRVGYSDHVRFRGYFPVHSIPAYNLPVYASRWPLPDTTQDSVRGCSLGFTAAAISGDGDQRTCKAQLAQNLKGASSEWTTYTFNCSEADDAMDETQQCPIGYSYHDGSCVFSSCPIGYEKQGTECVFKQCPTGYTLQGGACLWSGCPEGFFEQGGQCVAASACASLPYCSGKDLLNGCTHKRIEACQYGCATGRCNPAPVPSASITATPSLVYRDGSARISWTSRNTASCAVTSANGDSWTGLTGSNKSSLPITQRTTFTLRCEGLPNADPAFIERSVTVNVRAVESQK